MLANGRRAASKAAFVSSPFLLFSEIKEQDTSIMK
jgi:hypothetical protein